jgi:geranylgeranyl pyrophosphate synthase
MLDLIMLLITKMVNEGKEITPNQQSLSSSIQMIHIGNLIHQKGMFDLSQMPDHGNSLSADDDLITGNKIALLAGDFLLANEDNFESHERCRRREFYWKSRSEQQFSAI